MFEAFFYETADPRVRDYAFCGSPWPTLSLVVFYLLFAHKIGPWLVRNRPPLELRNLLLTYNVFQILINAIPLILAIPIIKHLTFSCTELDKSYSEKALTIIWFHYLYFINKIVDLMDTVFIALKKKDSQMSFLHVYHHGSVVLGAFYFLHIAPGGQLMFLGFINSFVHIIMYSYYFITLWNKNNGKNNIWWKKYLTQLQIFQFVFLLVCFVVPLFNSSCGYPKPYLLFYATQMVLMLYLFGKFYYNAYIREKPVKKLY